MERINFRIIKIHLRNNDLQSGFTLIELLVVLVIFSVASTAIYASYLTQLKTYHAQTQVTAMQQSLRVGMYQMGRELRMAGFDPHRTAKAGFISANTNEIIFTYDRNENGKIIDSTNDSSERLHYAWADNSLKREVWNGNLQVLAENIEVLDLVFLDEDNQVLNPDFGEVSSFNLKKIKSVQITMVARTDKPDPEYRNTKVYRNQQDDIILAAQNDHFRRRTLTTTIRCRNMGL